MTRGPGPVRVAAGAIVRDGRVLICQRRASDRYPGKWEFPGGKIEPGESTRECARRELHEELGIEVEPGEEIWHTLFPADAPEVDITFVAVNSFRGEPTNLCFAQILWVEMSALPGFDFLEADREFIGALASL